MFPLIATITKTDMAVFIAVWAILLIIILSSVAYLGHPTTNTVGL